MTKNVSIYRQLTKHKSADHFYLIRFERAHDVNSMHGSKLMQLIIYYGVTMTFVPHSHIKRSVATSCAVVSILFRGTSLVTRLPTLN